MLLRGSHLRCVFYDKLFTDSSKSPRAWFAKFSGLLFAFGFTSSATDPTVLTKKTKGGLFILAIYIDDIILTRSDNTSILTSKTYLQQHLNIRDLGNPR